MESWLSGKAVASKAIAIRKGAEVRFLDSPLCGVTGDIYLGREGVGFPTMSGHSCGKPARSPRKREDQVRVLA